MAEESHLLSDAPPSALAAPLAAGALAAAEMGWLQPASQLLAALLGLVRAEPGVGRDASPRAWDHAVLAAVALHGAASAQRAQRAQQAEHAGQGQAAAEPQALACSDPEGAWAQGTTGAEAELAEQLAEQAQRQGAELLSQVGGKYTANAQYTGYTVHTPHNVHT